MAPVRRGGLAAKRRVLQRLWTEPGRSYAAFAGRHLLERTAAGAKTKLKTQDIKHYLSEEPAYTRHAPRRRKFAHPFYNLNTLYHLVEADLIETGRVAKFNDGTRYLLLAIECTSRKIFVRPMKDKKGSTSTAAFRHLLGHEFAKRPHTVRVDLGSEWKDSRFRKLLRERNIRLIFAHNTEKAAMCERAIQTLQRRIHRYLTHNNTLTFLPALKNIVQSINDSPHASTGVPPNQFGQSDVYNAWEKYYMSHFDVATSRRPRPFRFAPGDSVRASLLSHGLDKAYRGTYTPQLYTVSTRRYGRPHSYVLKDSANSEVAGPFFEQELIAARDRPDQQYMIDKIVARRTNPTTRKKEIQVTWEGWPSSVKTWLPASHVVVTGTRAK